MAENLVEMRNISKSFPGVKALDGVDFCCKPGEVHALVGENGAGKSTLIKILSGAYSQDDGDILLDGKIVEFSSPKEARRSGISTIYQEFNLIPELNVAENIFLGNMPLKKGRLIIDKKRVYDEGAQILDELGVSLNLKSKVKYLSVAQQQMVEIAKALSINARIIIMDEPTAVVSGKELESLYGIIRKFRDNGKSVIYISHRLKEIFDIADLATVLKDGTYVGTVIPKDVDHSRIVSMMVGRKLSETFPPKETGDTKEICTLRNVCLGKSLKDVSLSIRSGEILGIAGLGGSGRTELARAIFAADKIDSGVINFDGMPLKRHTPRLSIANGISFVTEDRKKEGIVQGLSVKKNITLVTLDKVSKYSFISKKTEDGIAGKAIDEYNIATPSIDQEIQYLSGGNQQKVILAKWVNAAPRLILMDEPTRGIDVGAKAEIYIMMRQLAKQGAAIVMISSELPEIIGMSDRIIVMHYGRIAGELHSSNVTEEDIMMLATGARITDDQERSEILE